MLSIDEEAPQRANGSAFKDPAFTENKGEPIHRWVPWIAGFSSGFVADCLSEYLAGQSPADVTVLDPFAGVGTTLVEAFHQGYNAIGFEINPWAALAGRAKLAASSIRLAEFDGWIRAFNAFMDRTAGSGEQPDSSVIPEGFRSRIAFYSPEVQRQVLWAMRFFESIADKPVKDMFVVAFGSVMVTFSNYSYEPSLGSRPGSGKPLIEHADVAQVITAKLRDMLTDCQWVQGKLGRAPSQRREVFADSIFNALDHIEAASVDLAITSPPYLNNYHYIRNTRPHLFWLRFIEKTTEMKTIEHASFGKFWQTVRDGAPIHLDFANAELEAVIQLIREANQGKGVYGGAGWANYAAQYFNDMNRLCHVMGQVLKPGGRAVVVIGNSILQGIELKVDAFLAQIGEANGLECEAIHMLRTKRVGNSIIRSAIRNGAGERASLYEVSVVLKRPN